MSKLPLDQFFKENENLIHFATKKAMARMAKTPFLEKVEREEIHQMLVEVFIKAYERYDASKYKFSTYYVTACQNEISSYIIDLNRNVASISVEEITTHWSNGEVEIDSDEIFKYTPPDLDQLEITDSLKAVLQKLSPFAKTLLEYTISPPEFIESEFEALKVKSDLMSNSEFRGFTPQDLNLKFVARKLGDTANSVAAKRFIKRAVEEVELAISSALEA
jgi:RNA polymerase sigma factor (sigma-70 family)